MLHVSLGSLSWHAMQAKQPMRSKTQVKLLVDIYMRYRYDGMGLLGGNALPHANIRLQYRSIK